MEYVDTGSSEKKFSTSIAKGKKEKHWSGLEWTLQEIKDFFSNHREASHKDGPAFAPVRLHGKLRRKDAVREISLLVYDIDGGQSLEDALQLIRERSLYAIVYTSYSHLKSTTSIEVKKFAEWASRNDRPAHPNQESVCEYLRTNGFDYLTGIRVIPELGGKDGEPAIVIEHDPIHKFRVVFPLKVPFDVHGSGMSTNDAAKLWESYYIGIGKELGLNFDPACADLTRIFYFPSHPPGAASDQYASMILEGELLDYQSFMPWEPEPAQSSTKKERARSGKKHRLSGFGGRYGKTFKIADALEAGQVAPIRGKRPGGGLFIDCPFIEQHTGDSPCRTFVANGDGDSGFVIYCSGAHCNIDGQQATGWIILRKCLSSVGWILRISKIPNLAVALTRFAARILSFGSPRPQ